jgi:molybdopterin-guanine dinucleotide biosynthesis protein A
VEPLIAILAGGRGKRLGGEKPSLDLGGRPLIDHPIAAATGARGRVAVFAKPETVLPDITVPVIREPAEPHHPLLGIVTALDAAEGAPVLAVACDLPFVTADLIDWLAGRPEPLAIPGVDGRLHPLLGRYDPGLAEALRLACEREAAVQETVRELGPRVIDEAELSRFGDPRRLVFNVNTPEDLAEARRLLGKG